MQETNMLNEIIRLPIEKRITLIESVLASVRKDLCLEKSPSENLRQQMAAAAETLCRDYLQNDELTAFTVLDSEDYYEQRRDFAHQY